MVPSLYVPILQMPLNMSLKLDRRVVEKMIETISNQQLQLYAAGGAMVKVAPTTETEHQLQALWAKSLGIDSNLIGVHDHFFQLGGDSIIAMRIIASAHMLN